MKVLKNIFMALLAGAMLFALASCSGAGDGGGGSDYDSGENYVTCFSLGVLIE